MLVLDTSALLKRYVAEQGTDEVLAIMEKERHWFASALCECEARVTLCHLGFAQPLLEEKLSALANDWQRFYVVPVDDICLERAAEIGCQQRLRTLDAIHLAAAERLPRPTPFLTFDRRQSEAAVALGLELAGAPTP